MIKNRCDHMVPRLQDALDRNVQRLGNVGCKSNLLCMRGAEKGSGSYTRFINDAGRGKRTLVHAPAGVSEG